MHYKKTKMRKIQPDMEGKRKNKTLTIERCGAGAAEGGRRARRRANERGVEEARWRERGCRGARRGERVGGRRAGSGMSFVSFKVETTLKTVVDALGQRKIAE